jgi:preprotein translocase subunit Sec61beta
MSDDRGAVPKPEGRAREAGFLQTVRAVLWSFFGVRKRSGYEQDAAQLNPVYVVIAGVIAAVAFVVALLVVVRMVVG